MNFLRIGPRQAVPPQQAVQPPTVNSGRGAQRRRARQAARQAANPSVNAAASAALGNGNGAGAANASGGILGNITATIMTALNRSRNQANGPQLPAVPPLVPPQAPAAAQPPAPPAQPPAPPPPAQPPAPPPAAQPPVPAAAQPPVPAAAQPPVPAPAAAAAPVPPALPPPAAAAAALAPAPVVVAPTPTPSGNSVADVIYSITKTAVDVTEFSVKALYNAPAFALASAGTLTTPKTWAPWTNNYTNAKKSLGDKTGPVEKLEVGMGGGQVLEADAINGKILDKRSPGRKAGEAVAHSVAGLAKLAFIADIQVSKLENTTNALYAATGALHDSISHFEGFVGGVRSLNNEIMKAGARTCQTSNCDALVQYVNGAVEVTKKMATNASATALTAANVAGTVGSAYVFAKAYTKLHETATSQTTTISDKVKRGGKMVAYGTTTAVSGVLTAAGAAGGVAGQLNMGKNLVSGAGYVASSIGQAAIPIVKAIAEHGPGYAASAAGYATSGAGHLATGLGWAASGISEVAVPLAKAIAAHPVHATTAVGSLGTLGLAAKARYTYQPGSRLKAVGWGAAAVAAGAATAAFSYYNLMSGVPSGTGQENSTAT